VAYRTHVLLRSNLHAGLRITAIGRFRHLFLNLGTYQQAGSMITHRRGFHAQKTTGEEIWCTTAAAGV
jgi:hypothetical protein